MNTEKNNLVVEKIEHLDNTEVEKVCHVKNDMADQTINWDSLGKRDAAHQEENTSANDCFNAFKKEVEKIEAPEMSDKDMLVKPEQSDKTENVQMPVKMDQVNDEQSKPAEKCPDVKSIVDQKDMSIGNKVENLQTTENVNLKEHNETVEKGKQDEQIEKEKLGLKLEGTPKEKVNDDKEVKETPENAVLSKEFVQQADILEKINQESKKLEEADMGKTGTEGENCTKAENEDKAEKVKKAAKPTATNEARAPPGKDQTSMDKKTKVSFK